MNKRLRKKLNKKREQVEIFQYAASGQASKIQELIEAGNDINKKDIGGYTPLHFAVQENHLMSFSYYFHQVRELI
jgi:ankyrin repeat protein